jgi:Phosphoenolpyruvate carboxykinase (ATP)
VKPGEDKGAYDAAATDLIKLFKNNFERFDVSEEIISAGPSDQ